MTFLHPWAILLGVLAAGVPFAVHLLTKPRPVRLPLSTLRFLREVVHQRRARHVLRDVLILLLRTSAVLLIALAIARPQWGGRPLISDQTDGDAVRVVALDVSQSMAATDRGVAALERARTSAANFLRYRPGLKANLILVGAGSRAVFDAPSVNFDQLRDELAQAAVLPERVDVRKLVETAGKILAPVSPEDHRRRELVIVSDFQRSSWAKADFTSLPEGTQIQWESVAPSETLPNLAILDVRVNARELASGSSQCEIDLYNGTPHGRQLEIELHVGESLWNLKATCPPESTTTLTQEIPWKQTGWQAGEARLVDLDKNDVDDALSADNVRPFAVDIPAEPNYLLVTRQPANMRPSSAYFLECALALRQTAEGKPATVRRTDPSEIDSASLASADLIVIDHPGKLSDDTVKLLAGFFRRGKPVLYVASESQDAVNLKSLLEAVGGSVQLPVEFVPPLAGRLRRDLTLISVKRDRSPFNVFGDHLNGVLGQLRFSGGLGSRRWEGRPDDDVLAMYDDGSASVVSVMSDAGALTVINADLNESNLPKTGAFVPLIEELVRGLMDRERGNKTANCGEPLFVQLPANAGPAHLLNVFDLKTAGMKNDQKNEQTVADEKKQGELVDEETGTVWHWNSPDRPGVYGVKRGEEIVFAKAVAIPPEESELASLDMKNLGPRLAGGHATYYRNVADGGERRDDFWIWLAAGCVLCMIGEVGTMLAFRD
ncbi:MAG: BatA domain-containing protein [Planctomycetaceae bacterium]|nr:BatA domain-containing protein [Planctomycetaceae bacterium]